MDKERSGNGTYQYVLEGSGDVQSFTGEFQDFLAQDDLKPPGPITATGMYRTILTWILTEFIISNLTVTSFFSQMATSPSF